jgi:HAE1 family hydrophobic/amphiphilic exporter-1
MFSLACSLLVSLSLLPMLASRLLGSRGADRPGLSARIRAVGDRFFGAIDDTYRDFLRAVLRFRAVTVLLAAAVLIGTWLLLPHLGSEFLPPSDEGEVRVTGEMEVGTRLEIVDRQARRMEEIVFPAVPELVSSVTSVGASGRNASAASEGRINLTLVPATRRERSNVDVADDLRKLLDGAVPGMKIRVRAQQGQFLLERILGGGEGIEIEILGYDLDTLSELAKRAGEALASVEGVTDVRVSREAGTPQQEIRIDRDKVADLGLSVRDVTEALETAVAGSRAGEYRVAGNSYRILVRLADAEKRSLEEILDLTLSTPGGEQVALRNLVTTRDGFGPILIERQDRQRVVRIETNITGRDQGSAARDMEAALARIPRPAGYDLRIAGDVEEQTEAFDELALSLYLALALVYMVLACQYESLRDPLVVMFSVPVAGVGVVLALLLTDSTFNLQSFIGCIMLGGIVVNNAILLVDQAGRLRQEGRSVGEAIVEAGRRRLRPILMTTSTTVLALLPLALGVGEGADAQAPMARAVVGGLVGSTLITLALIPAVYSLFHREAAP